MKNPISLKTCAAIVGGFAFLIPNLIFILLSLLHLFWPAKIASFGTSDFWSILIISFFNLGILVLISILLIHTGKHEFELGKIKATDVIRQQMTQEERQHYEQSREERLQKENYDKALAFFKYLHQSDDCKNPETGLPSEKMLEEINQLIKDHVSIINMVSKPEIKPNT